MEDWQEGYTWLNGLELLSLDFLRPVYSELGTAIAQQETLRGLARDAMLRRLDEQDAGERQSPAGMSLFLHSQVEALIHIVGSALGAQAARALTHWVRFVQCQESTNPWTRYQNVLSSWASDFRRCGADAIGFSLDPRQIASRLREAASSERVRRILERQSRAFLTPWDFPLFKNRGVLELAQDSPFFPFVDAALLTVEMHRFQVFWAWLLADAPRRDLEALDAFVRARGGTDTPHIAAWELPQASSKHAF